MRKPQVPELDTDTALIVSAMARQFLDYDEATRALQADGCTTEEILTMLKQEPS